MIQASNDVAQLLRTAGASTSSAGMPPAYQNSGPGFRASFNRLSNLQDETPGPSDLRALSAFLNRLSQLEAAMTDAGEAGLDSAQLQGLAQEMGRAIAEFEAATGLHLRASLEALYVQPSASGDPSTLQPVGESAEAGLSALTTLIDLASVLSKTLVGLPAGGVTATTNRGDTSVANSATPQSSVAQAALLQAGVPANPEEAPSAAETVPSRDGRARSAVPSAGDLRAQIETAAAAIPAKAAGRQTHLLPGDANGKIDVRTAIALALTGAATGQGSGNSSQSAFDFTAAVAHNQLIPQPGLNGFGLADGTRFSDLLPRDAQGILSAVSENPASQEKASSADLPKPSRFAAAIAEQLRNAEVNEGMTKIELSPRGLGNIEIQVSTEPDGATTVVIRADNSSVLSALREIRDPLTQLINMESGGTLSFEDRPGSQSGREGQGQSLASTDTGFRDPDASLSSSAETVIINGRQLDITT